MTFNLVVAGSYTQYQDWVRENRLNPKDFQYIGDLQKLQGIDRANIFLVGDYTRSIVFNDILRWNYLISRREVIVLDGNDKKEIEKARKRTRPQFLR